jgi:hypothetical protein
VLSEAPQKPWRSCCDGLQRSSDCRDRVPGIASVVLDAAPLLGPTISAIFGLLHLAFVAGLRSMTMSMTSHAWRALGQVVLVYFAVGGAAVTAQDSRPARATFAEMIAFARIASVACQRLAPDADSFHALALRGLIKPPITEEEIAAKEKNIKRLRVRLGLSRWCKRYAAVMEQARILVQVLRRQN